MQGPLLSIQVCTGSTWDMIYFLDFQYASDLLRPLNRCIASKLCLRLTSKWHLNCFLFEGDHSHPQTFSHTAQLFLTGSFESSHSAGHLFFLPRLETGFCFSQALALAYVKVMPTPSPCCPPQTDISWQVYYMKCNPLHSFLAHHQVLKSSTGKKQGTFLTTHHGTLPSSRVTGQAGAEEALGDGAKQLHCWPLLALCTHTSAWVR